MRILHLMSQTHLTGPEVFVATLARYQQAAGDEVFIISDTLTVKTDVSYTSMHIHRRKPHNRIINIYKLVRFCKQNRIDLIHAHSRAASWLANIVRLFLPVTFVSTVHGKQSVHQSSQRANVYGDHIMVICDYLKEHLQQDLKINQAEIHLVRNCVE